jgi:hypothetical protein
VTTLADLTPDPKNARRHNPRNIGQVQSSLQKYGAARSIVIDENGQIIAGHGVVEAAALAGMEKVQVVDGDGETIIAVRRSGLTKQQKQELGIADNRGAELAEWNPDVLAELAGEIDLSQFWSDSEIKDLLGEQGGTGDGTEDEIPSAPARVQAGETWALGRHRIACIDSLDREVVLVLLDGAKPAFVWADPPYGISIVDVKTGALRSDTKQPFGGKKRAGTVGASKPFGSKAVRGTDGSAHMIDVNHYAPVIGDETTDTALKSFKLYHGEIAPKALHVWWGANHYANGLPGSPCWIVWDKENTGNFADAELAWCSSDTAVRIFRHMWNGLMKASEKGQKRTHPTQKPIALAEWAFEKYGKAGDVIVDPFLGSGISVLAAEKLNDGRAVYGAELSPEYCDVTIARWEALTGQTAVLA